MQTIWIVCAPVLGISFLVCFPKSFPFVYPPHLRFEMSFMLKTMEVESIQLTERATSSSVASGEDLEKAEKQEMERG